MGPPRLYPLMACTEQTHLTSSTSYTKGVSRCLKAGRADNDKDGIINERQCRIPTLSIRSTLLFSRGWRKQGLTGDLG